MQKLFTITLIFFIIFTLTYTQTSLELGWEWYNKRAEGAKGTEASAAPVDKAIKYFLTSIKDPASEESAAVGLLKGYYFKATFVPMKKNERKELYKAGRELGEKMRKKFPGSLDMKYWYGVNMGKWAEIYSKIAAAREGVADKLKKLSEEIIEADPVYDRGSAYMFLGRVHHQTPKIPFILKWPSKKISKECYKKAIEIAPGRIISRYYLADLLADRGKKDEAIKILEELILKKPEPDNLVEDRSDLAGVKRLLEKLKK
ncbi:tetratricopeptide repeat protein [Spirochaetota bacterium]